MTWDVHHQVWGRSAGFPARLGDELVCEGAARAAAEVGAAHRRVVDVEAELRALLDAASADLALEARRLARRTRRALARGRDLPAALDLGSTFERTEWSKLVALRAQHRAALAAALEVCRVESVRGRETERSALRRLIGEPRVADAAAHTSRSLAAGFARALADAAAASGPARLVERRMLLFLQRLTAKPAMMADAGPCFWGTLDGVAADTALRAAPGDALVRARHVRFEHWAALAIARRMQADPDLAPHCVVRLNPSCLLDGPTLFYPIAHRLRLEPREAQVLRWCTEGHTLGELRRTISEHSAEHSAAHPAEERAELEQLLGTHLKSGVATADIPVPAATDPEAALLAFLARVPDDCAGKLRWLERLGQLAALRDELARTAGPARRGAAQRLDALFVETADAAPTRNPGQLHGARFVTYEDCARDVEVALGGALARDLAELAPVLELSSWIARTCAERYEQRLRPAHARLARNLNSVDYITFIRETQWITDTPEVVIEIRRELQRAWEAQLGDRLAASGPLALSPDDVRGVLAQLDPPDDRGPDDDGAPWLPAADCHGLNVLAAAASADAFARGQYELVVHKLYKGVPLWLHPAVLPFCPDPGAALAAFEAWCRAPILQLVDSASAYHRSNLNLPIVESLWEAEIPNGASRAPADRTIPCAQLEVIQERGRLHVCSHDRRIQSGFFAVRWSFLQHKLLGIPVHPEPEAGAPSHRPRVTFGRWVLAREQWRFATAPLLRRWDRASPLAAIAAWRAEHRIPDRVFVKVPGQQKSIAIDLRSALQCDLLRALAAQSSELTITEMAPAPGDTWLPDRAGATYVSELRFTALRRPDPTADRRSTR